MERETERETEPAPGGHQNSEEPRSPGRGATANRGGPGTDRGGMAGPTPILSTFQQHRQSAGAATSTRVEADRSGVSRILGGPLPGNGTQLDSDFYADAREKDSGPDRRNSPWSPDAVLTDTVARLQRDLDDMRTESRYLRTAGVQGSLRQPRQVTFTSTNVLKFAGVTSWDQYRQMFDVRSNGWDNATAALQLLSHLEGDALNVALLVPASRRASRVGLVEALSAHYGSPGRLADYRRQFERTTRTSGEDPSISNNSIGDVGHKGLWGHGSDGTASYYPRSFYSRAS